MALRRVASLADQTDHRGLTELLSAPRGHARAIVLDPHEIAEEPWFDSRWRVRWPMPPERVRELLAA